MSDQIIINLSNHDLNRNKRPPLLLITEFIPSINKIYCDKLEFVGTADGFYKYNCVGTGYIRVNLYDMDWQWQASLDQYCAPPAQVNIEGNHQFECI